MLPNNQTQGIGNYLLVMGATGLILYVILENKTNPQPYWAYGYYGSHYTSSIMSTSCGAFIGFFKF